MGYEVHLVFKDWKEAKEFIPDSKLVDRLIGEIPPKELKKGGEIIITPVIMHYNGSSKEFKGYDIRIQHSFSFVKYIPKEEL